MKRIEEGIHADFQKHLIDLTVAKNVEWIERNLSNVDKAARNRVFTWYLAALYRANGYLVKVRSVKEGKISTELEEGKMDILLHHPRKPNSVLLAVRGFYHDAPLTFEQAHYQLLEHERVLAPVYHCDQFQLTSFHGFSGESKGLGQFNMLLYAWNDIKDIILNDAQIILFAHQQRAYEEAWRLWNSGETRVAIVHATGTGKSYIVGKIIKDVRESGGRVLVMAPIQYILGYQLPKVIPWITEDANITRMSYRKGASITEEEIQEINPELIVLDEFHRCGAEQWGAGVQRILDAYPRAKVLGTTATHIRYLENGRNMADELFNGTVASEISLLDAIRDKILPQPKFVSAFYALDEDANSLKEKLGKSDLGEEEKRQIAKKIEETRLNWRRTMGVPQILKKHLTPDYRKILVFCKDIPQMDLMIPKVTRWIRETGLFKKVQSFRVHYKEQENDENFRLFNETPPKGTAYLLFSIEMLNEGVHIDGVHSVVQFRSTTSPRITLQQWGRCIDTGSVVTPLIFDLVNNAKNVRLDDVRIEGSEEGSPRKKAGLEGREILIVDETRDILEVLNDISDQLAPWEVQFAKLQKFVEERGHARPSNSHSRMRTWAELSLGEWVVRQRLYYRKGLLAEDKIRALESLPGWTWDPVYDKWHDFFRDLQEFAAGKGHSSPNGSSKNPEERRLGVWANRQRQHYKKKLLSKERIALLESLPGWTWNACKADWQESFRKLQEFAKRTGHARPNTSSKNPEERRLGVWANRQRQHYKKKLLSKERIALLESLPGWTWKVHEDSWQENFRKLQEFVQRTGHARPRSTADDPVEENLGKWVIHQRGFFNKGKLSKERIALLESLPGWTWNACEADWQESFRKLQEFVQRTGHARPRSVSKDPLEESLGKWAVVQRLRFNKGKLSKERIALLESLPGWTWNACEADWQESFRKLQEFVQRTGHARPRSVSKDPQEEKSGKWVAYQRVCFHRGQLSKERIALLESLPGWTWKVNIGKCNTKG